MEMLHGYLDETDRNARLIQLVIRYIDDRSFIDCLVGLDEPSRAAIFRNISRKAAEAVAADLAERAASVRPEAVLAARSLFLRLLARFERRERAGSPPAAGFDGSARSLPGLRDDLLHVAIAARDGDYGRLEAFAARSGDRLMREGLRALVDAEDPLAARARLERLRDVELADYGRRLDMTLDAFDSLMSHDQPGETAERLAVYLGDA